MLFTKNILLVDENENDIVKFKAVLNSIDSRVILNVFNTLQDATAYAANNNICSPDVIFIHSRLQEETALKLLHKIKAGDVKENLSIQFLGTRHTIQYNATKQKYNTFIFSLAENSDEEMTRVVTTGLDISPNYKKTETEFYSFV